MRISLSVAKCKSAWYSYASYLATYANYENIVRQKFYLLLLHLATSPILVYKIIICNVLNASHACHIIFLEVHTCVLMYVDKL